MIKKILALVLSMLICLGLTTLNAHATSEKNDGLEIILNTDKEQYLKSDEISATLTVTNTNDYPINNVLLETIIPEKYELSKNSNNIKNISELKPEETIVLNVKFISKNDQSTIHSNTNTGDQSNIKKWLILLAFSCCVMITIIIFNRKSKQNIILILISFFLSGSIIAESISKVSAYDSKFISLSKTIKIENENITISANITYDLEFVDNNEELTSLPKPENPTESEEYYWNNFTVLKVLNATDSNELLSEKQAISLLKDRGFNTYDITTNYTVNGDYLDEKIINNSSDEKHPFYETYYVNKNKEVWTIYIINGTIYAFPVSFSGETGIEMSVSESKEITSYDDFTNTFYIVIPKNTDSPVITVNRIDAQTLDSLTIKEMKK